MKVLKTWLKNKYLEDFTGAGRGKSPPPHFGGPAGAGLNLKRTLQSWRRALQVRRGHRGHKPSPGLA